MSHSGIVVPDGVVPAQTMDPKPRSGKVLRCGGLWLNYDLSKRFPNDSTIAEDPEVVVLFDGILLNHRELMVEHAAASISHLLLQLYRKCGIRLADTLRGEFCVLVWEKGPGVMRLFTNHTSSKPIYFARLSRPVPRLFFSTSVASLAELLRAQQIACRLSEFGAYCHLTYGYMLETATLLDGVQKVPPAACLTYNGGVVNISRWEDLRDLNEVAGSLETHLDAINERLTSAIRQEYAKDSQYGYSHVVTLSGGLDSRVNLLVARALGFVDQTVLTFSQSGHADETTPRRICSDLGLPMHYYPLDGGAHLCALADATDIDGGQAAANGAVHTLAAVKSFNFASRYGILHTGQLGDAVLGSYLKGPRHTSASFSAGANSTLFLNRIKEQATEIARKYPTEEMFKYYNRGLNGILCGNWMIQSVTECVSPFLHRDFVGYILSVPPRYRFREGIYLRWIDRCLPAARQWPWDKWGARPTLTNYHLGRPVRWLRRASRWACRKTLGERPTWSMNPMQYWLQSNKELRVALQQKFDECLPALDGYEQLSADCRRQFLDGTAQERLQALSLAIAADRLLRGRGAG